MDNKERLISIITDYINYMKNKIEREQSRQFDEEKFVFLRDAVDTVIEDKNNLKNLNLSGIKEYFPDINEDIYVIIDFYKMSLQTSFGLSEENIRNLNKILEAIKNKVESKIEELKKAKLEFQENGSKEIEKYKLLVEKINNNFDLDEENVNLIYKMLKESTLSIEESINIMRFIAEELSTTLVIDDEHIDISEEEPEELEETNLLFEELETLFKEYKTDFNKFSISEQKELQKYGNLENIRGILQKLADYDIVSLNEYLKSQSLQICKILLGSNANIIESVFEKCIKFNIVKRNENKEIIYVDGKSIIDFQMLLGHPSQFLKRKKNYIRKKPNTTTGGPGSEDNLVGSYQDFLQNIEYFAKEGLDISKAYQKSGDCFCAPHEQIKESIKTFYLYSIGKEFCFSTLSCLKDKNQADAIDLFTELGHLDYLKLNLSRALLSPESPTFYKLARAKQLGITPRRYGKGLEGSITDKKIEYLGITESNGKEITGQYTFEFDEKNIFDDIISANRPNNTINIALEVEKRFIGQLDKKYILYDEDGYPNLRVYNINGIIFSRLKFLRICNTLVANGIELSLNSILYCLTRNSIITKEEFKIVYNEISSLYNSYLNSNSPKR